jgi:hypothetical protein
MHRRLVLIFFLFISTYPALLAQVALFEGKIMVENIEIKRIQSADSLTFDIELRKLVKKWVYNGYLLASLDSIELSGNPRKAFLHKGKKIGGVQVESIKAPIEVSTHLNTLLRIKNKVVSIPSFTTKIEKSLKWLANNGYPFAKLEINVLTIYAEHVRCNVQIDKGAYVTYDSVVLFGEVKLSKSFIKYFLGIAQGEAFNESKIQNLPDRLSSLNYLSLDQDPIVLFQKNKASVIIRLKEVQANKVNALIGLAPQSTNNSNKLLLTGMADIGLVNLTGNREEISLDWQRFLKNSQSLKTGLYIPYIPYVNIGTTLNFGLIKFDSNYLQTQTRIGLSLFSSNNLKWSIFYSADVTSLLSADTGRIRSTFSFPTINATSNKAYGIQVEKMKWKNQFNPWKGYYISLMGSAGTKRINRDNRIEQVEFVVNNRTVNLYDTLPLTFNQYLMETDFRFVQPLKGKKYVLFTQVTSGFNLSKEIFFQDLYRLGGYRTLKGFDEQSLFANQFVTASMELRYRFNDLSNAFLFVNGMYLKNESIQFSGNKEDLPYGFGLGANINTGNTVLSMAYGYGVQKGIPININQGKFHFGLVSYF